MKLPVFQTPDQFIEEELRQNIWRVNPKPGDWVMDIGANKGGVTALCALNGASVVAYEPNPIAFELLEETIKLNHIEKQVTAIPAAVHTKTGTTKMTYNRIKSVEKRVHG